MIVILEPDVMLVSVNAFLHVCFQKIGLLISLMASVVKRARWHLNLWRRPPHRIRTGQEDEP